jgi:hypothetical protein
LAAKLLSQDRPGRSATGQFCSLIGQGEMLFVVSTPWDACVLCALAGA